MAYIFDQLQFAKKNYYHRKKFERGIDLTASDEVVALLLSA